jgi:uncharacterized protein YjbI with pentapeptide repeats
MRVKSLVPFPFGTKVTSRNPPRPEMALIVRGTFAIAPGRPLAFVEELDQGSLSAEVFHPEDHERLGECLTPGDFTDFKPRADVLLRGTCHPPGGRVAAECPVRFSVGKWSKALRVVGRRVWTERLVGAQVSEPAPFASMPLGYPNAFGGPGYLDNPIGKGFGTPELPNVEYPGEELRAKGDRVRPASFGPVNPIWPLRAAKVGKEYGKAYRARRAPYYAEDFDWTHFNAAPPDQQLPGYLRGDEEVSFQNLHAEIPLIEARLPGLRIRAFVRGTDGRLREVTMNLDTLFADVDGGVAALTWRGLDAVAEDDLSDVATVLIALEAMTEARLPLDHYRKEMEAFEADPIGLRDLPPEGFAELTERLEQERRGERMAEEPGVGSKARLEAMRQRGLAGMSAGDRAQLEALEAVLAKTPGATPSGPPGAADPDPAPPLVPLKPGAKPPLGLRQRMRALLVEAERLKRAAALLGAPAPAPAAQIDELVRDPRLSELDPSYVPPSLDDPPPEEPGPERDLAGQDLTGRDLRGKNLTRADLTGAILTNADLTGACLAGARLKYAVLYKAALEGADLTGADLTMAQLSQARAARADFTGAILDQASFQGADLAGATLARAAGEYVQLTRADLTGAKAPGCKLPASSFDQAVLERADLTGAELTRCVFTDARAQGAVMTRAKLGCSTFERADLRGAVLAWAEGVWTAWMEARLDGADLHCAWMPGSHFTEASAKRAIFREANLREAIFYRAAMAEASFELANLFGADLRKTALKGVTFRGANLYDAKLLGAAGEGCDFEGANLKRSTLEAPP